MKKIMMVDDNSDLTYVVKKRFEKTKTYKVFSANSGKECIDLLQKGKIPDIILLDIMMPEISGWDTFAKLKANNRWSKIPIVFLTAKNDSYSKEQGKASASDYIEKPFEFSDLKKRIEYILD
jgi:CheY-like chemotaxis protein